MNLDWKLRAACRGYPFEVFFPERGDNSCTEAREVCARCPVIDECRTYALETGQNHGIWAGMARTELRRVRTRRTLQCSECFKEFSVRADRSAQSPYCSQKCRHDAKLRSQRRSAERARRAESCG